MPGGPGLTAADHILWAQRTPALKRCEPQSCQLLASQDSEGGNQREISSGWLFCPSGSQRPALTWKGLRAFVFELDMRTSDTRTTSQQDQSPHGLLTLNSGSTSASNSFITARVAEPTNRQHSEWQWGITYSAPITACRTPGNSSFLWRKQAKQSDASSWLSRSKTCRSGAGQHVRRDADVINLALLFKMSYDDM